MTKPLVSVVLPVYNAAPYLQACLDSIASQSYRPLELIAIDDHSEDNSLNILKKFAQDKSWVKILTNPKNLGVSPTFNKGVAKAKATYIARMDADDLMHKDRIKKQLDFLLTHPDVVAVGSQCQLIDKHGHPTGQKLFPTSHQQIKDMLFRTVPMQQPSIMINRSLLPKDFVFGDSRFSPAEDYDLFFRLLPYGKLANLPQLLHFYREHDTNISLVKPKFTFWKITRAKINAVLHHRYIPSLRSLTVFLAQLIAITLLPSSLIYPLHSKLRGMK